MRNNVASERVRAQLTQQGLANELNVSLSTVCRWEQQVGDPSGTHLVNMRNLFGCSTDYLLGLSEERIAG